MTLFVELKKILYVTNTSLGTRLVAVCKPLLVCPPGLMPSQQNHSMCVALVGGVEAAHVKFACFHVALSEVLITFISLGLCRACLHICCLSALASGWALSVCSHACMCMCACSNILGMQPSGTSCGIYVYF